MANRQQIDPIQLLEQLLAQFLDPPPNVQPPPFTSTGSTRGVQAHSSVFDPQTGVRIPEQTNPLIGPTGYGRPKDVEGNPPRAIPEHKRLEDIPARRRRR
jgi:hypothetical protein